MLNIYISQVLNILYIYSQLYLYLKKRKVVMASHIEHALVVISSKVEKKYNDDDLSNLIKKLAQCCSSAGFPGEDGFTGDHKSNKEVSEITKLIQRL
jgi:transposase